MRYNEIINIINNELCLEKSIIKDILFNNFFDKELLCFFDRGKKIRSALMFLILKSLDIRIEKKHLYLASAVELMHNASLVHDDIIDNAVNRRKKITFNQKYGNSVSVILGDYLFALSTRLLTKIDNNGITKLFSNTMQTMCEGEFEQHFEKGKILTLQNYIDKSYKKTGMLFETAIKSILFDTEYEVIFCEFAKNFGIAFQIKDDYNNIYKNIENSDIKEKIYTAPVIFAANDYQQISSFSEDKIIKTARQEKYKIETENLIQSFMKIAIEKIDFLQDNEYKSALKNLCEYIERN